MRRTVVPVARRKPAQSPGGSDCLPHRCQTGLWLDRQAGGALTPTGHQAAPKLYRVGKQALVMYGRYGHAKQYKRRKAKLRFPGKRLGRVIRDIKRKIRDEEALEEVFAMPLQQAEVVIRQQKHKRGQKMYALHAPEVECSGKGKARKPYEFGCKVSVTTTNARSPGGMFVLHARAFLPGPFMAILMMAIRSAPLSGNPRPSPAWNQNASMWIRAEAMMPQIRCGYIAQARSGV